MRKSYQMKESENLSWIFFKYGTKLRYSTPSKYYPSPWPGVKCNKKIENHPCILEIEKQIPSDVVFPFSFRKVTLTEIIECGVTLKRVCDITKTYSQMPRTDKYSQHNSIIWPVWLNGWVFVYELKWLWVRVQLQSLKLQVSRLLRARGSLAFK